MLDTNKGELGEPGLANMQLSIMHDSIFFEQFKRRKFVTDTLAQEYFAVRDFLIVRNYEQFAMYTMVHDVTLSFKVDLSVFQLSFFYNCL